MTSETDSKMLSWLRNLDAATVRKLQEELPATQLWTLLLDVLELSPVAPRGVAA